jgi:hypothetical protein
MTDLRKAAEMALEALEDIFGKEKKDVGAINALRQALAQHECSRSHPHENMDSMCELRTENARLTNENARLKKALAQPEQEPEQEPVAWMFQHSETGNLTFFDNPTMVKLFGESNKRWGSAIPLYVHAEKCAEITKQGAEKCGR